MLIGEWEVFAVETGRIRLDGGAMFGTVPKVVWEKSFPADERNRVELSMRCLLLQGYNRRVLVDVGAGDKWDPALRERYGIELVPGGLRGALTTGGVPPEGITDVILTHLHFDHAGGATMLGEGGEIVPAFPNARVHVQRRNLEWARKPNERERASYLPENFEPLDERELLKLHDGNSEVLPGVTVTLSNAHTEGMQLVRVAGDGEDGQPVELWYTADLVPTASHVHLPWIAAYDLNALGVLEEKRALLGGIAGRNAWLVYEHDAHCVASKVQWNGARFEATEMAGEI